MSEEVGALASGKEPLDADLLISGFTPSFGTPGNASGTDASVLSTPSSALTGENLDGLDQAPNADHIDIDLCFFPDLNMNTPLDLPPLSSDLVYT